MKASEWHGGTPGSDEARTNGCKCPTMDNCRGRGRYMDGERFGWWINERCPLHAKTQCALYEDGTECEDAECKRAASEGGGG